MLTLSHIKEVIETALSHIKRQKEADEQQYLGANEGIRFLGDLLQQRHDELVKKEAQDAATANRNPEATSGAADAAKGTPGSAGANEAPSAPPAAG